MDKFFKLPANDLPSWVGFVATVIVVVIVAKHLPVIGKHV